jgi:cytochrome c oxidase subunit IV
MFLLAAGLFVEVFVECIVVRFPLAFVMFLLAAGLFVEVFVECIVVRFPLAFVMFLLAAVDDGPVFSPVYTVDDGPMT